MAISWGATFKGRCIPSRASRSPPGTLAARLLLTADVARPSYSSPFRICDRGTSLPHRKCM
eukprot:5251342-Pyramimonas_sp.AAC.1